LLLAGCSDWNEQSETYADYGQYAAGKYAAQLPPTLVPHSAREIHVVFNIDSTDIDAKFAFDRADAERVISPFRTADQIRLHELERSGVLPPSHVENPLFVRCSDTQIEYLQITGMAAAHYWTSHDPKLRKLACNPVPGPPMISV